ncbi:thioesterase family protein [Pollutibacter soli]|uniref:acyl-CoA thioesterase n=1 Tax=Pollutibacter soli TaxID=3034157 RepID=UPI0030133FF4
MSQQRKFEIKIKVTDADIDQLKHANNVVYLRWAQDAAAAHWNVLSGTDIRKANAWVVLRHEIDYKYPALLNEELTLLTWVGETAGVKSVRHVEIYNSQGQLSAAVKTTWCLIDPVTMKPKRISREMEEVLFQAGVRSKEAGDAADGE